MKHGVYTLVYDDMRFSTEDRNDKGFHTHAGCAVTRAALRVEGHAQLSRCTFRFFCFCFFPLFPSGLSHLGGQHVGDVVDVARGDEDALGLLADLGVEARHDLGHGLDEGDLGAEGGVHV